MHNFVREEHITWDASAKKCRRMLTEHYPKVPSAHRIFDEIGLPTLYSILPHLEDLSGMIDYWHAAMREVAARKKTERLIRTVGEEHPEFLVFLEH